MSLAELAKREAQTDPPQKPGVMTLDEVIAYVKRTVAYREARGWSTGYEVRQDAEGWHIRWLDAAPPRVEG